MTAPPQVETIVETALDCTVCACETATGGRVAQTYLLELDGEPSRVVCKIGGPSVRTGAVIEPLVVALVTETTTIHCPECLGAGQLRDETDTPTHWALYEFCRGAVPTPFDELDVARQRRIVRQTGAMLGELHATHQFDRTGGLGRDGDSLTIETPAGLYVPERGREIARQHPAIDPSEWQPVLTHGDLFPGNLLVEGDTVTAFLDWGNAHVTTAGYALARAEMRFVDWFRFAADRRAVLTDALRKGYCEHRPLPPDYETLGTAYKLLWLGQSAERVLRHLTNSRGRAQMRRHLVGLLPGCADERA
jgi:aminoglycoside phosphotransferase (APT) family kinase protein